MTIEDIFKVAAAVIISTGGAGAILFGLSSWLGKVWANRILENEKAKHRVELEEFKAQLSQANIRYTKLHEKRAEIISEFYSLINLLRDKA